MEYDGDLIEKLVESLQRHPLPAAAVAAGPASPGAAPGDVIFLHPTEAHRADWNALFEGYATFYEVAQTPAMRDMVWQWIQDPGHEVKAVVAVSAAGHAVGLVHYRPFARPLRATTACFLDDLFVSPAYRGKGLADALIQEVVRISRAKGWSSVRWITSENNYRARAVYDRNARKLDKLTYEIELS